MDRELRKRNDIKSQHNEILTKAHGAHQPGLMHWLGAANQFMLVAIRTTSSSSASTAIKSVPRLFV